MIDLYTATTSNGHRAAIALEECGLRYRVQKVNLADGEQRKQPFLEINSAGQIPVIVDHEGPNGKPITVAQSGAIVLYAAEKSGRLIPRDPAQRTQALQWLMQACTDCAGASSALFQLSVLAPEKSPANVDFLESRLARYFSVSEAELRDRDYLAGELSIADVALYPVYAARKNVLERVGTFPNLARWGEKMAARPGVAKGMSASA